ncbi:MAG: zinc ribbon domain-containing protein [Verrucomicrobiales bacterium]|nr:zinc ribbon domain-containing protein [Verrucomicrobiales bacterium]
MPAPTNRRQLLAEVFAARARIEELSWQSATGVRHDESEMAHLGLHLSELIEAYRNSLGSIPLSRCPFTQQVWSRRMDISGLEGLWWDYEAPVRVAEMEPEHFVALTGSLRPSTLLEDFPFLCKPGPEVPYVLRFLMQRPGIKAVMSRLPIGPHEGTAITYFSETPAAGFAVPNEWGSSRHAFIAADGGLVTTQDRISDDEFDYDLRPYLAQGQLLWIHPDDGDLALQSGVSDCPYLDQAGRRSPLFISRGQVWTAEDPPDIEESSDDIPMVDFSDVMAEIESELDAEESPAPRAKAAPSPPPSKSAAHCPHCGGDVRPGAKFCGHCGKAMPPPSASLCPACGGEVRPGAKFCGHCGQSLK